MNTPEKDQTEVTEAQTAEGALDDDQLDDVAGGTQNAIKFIPI